MPSGAHIHRPGSLAMFREQTKGKVDGFVKTGTSVHVIRKASLLAPLALEDVANSDYGATWIIYFFVGSWLSVFPTVTNKIVFSQR